MGIDISHGVRGSRSATTIANLGSQLAHVLPSREWNTLRPYFGGRVRCPVSIPPIEARTIGQLLLLAGRDPRMPGEWQKLALILCDSAHRAYNAGENWEWS
ncbi:hypothetical protein ACFCXP_37635 [Streptomyces niveus]|uniref:DUF7739 domain-containing protein n=1 Tax=Streptomyces niveus TaxID=193462 RepID=UPI0035DA5FB9